jgi:hypothetical protein
VSRSRSRSDTGNGETLGFQRLEVERLVLEPSVLDYLKLGVVPDRRRE